VLNRAEEAARRIDQATEEWEVEFFDLIDDPQAETEPLRSYVFRLQPLRTSGAQLRQHLDDLRHGDFSWFDRWHDEGETGKNLADVHEWIERIQARLQGTRDRIQDSLALSATASIGRILTLANEAQSREGFQRAATFVTAFVLVPGLLATLYASGIQVPGGASEANRTIWLGILALLGGAATLATVALYAEKTELGPVASGRGRSRDRPRIRSWESAKLNVRARLPLAETPGHRLLTSASSRYALRNSCRVRKFHARFLSPARCRRPGMGPLDGELIAFASEQP
jgi:hypothetical protein